MPSLQFRLRSRHFMRYVKLLQEIFALMGWKKILIKYAWLRLRGSINSNISLDDIFSNSTSKPLSSLISSFFSVNNFPFFATILNIVILAYFYGSKFHLPFASFSSLVTVICPRSILNSLQQNGLALMTTRGLSTVTCRSIYSYTCCRSYSSISDLSKNSIILSYYMESEREWNSSSYGSVLVNANRN